VANSAEIVSGLSSIESKVDIVDTNVDLILLDTDELQQNQGDWLTATGFSTFNHATDQVIIATNNDKSGYSISGIKNTLDNLNDISEADVKAQADQALNEYDAATKAELDSAESSIISSIPSVANIADGVWDEPYSQHTTAGTFGKLMDILRKSNRAIEGEVTGTNTTTSFTSNMTGYVTGAFDSEVLVFVSGTINGEARPILSYNATNGTFNFEEAWTQAPSANDEFVILPYHVHAISEIHEGLATQASVDDIPADVDTELTSSHGTGSWQQGSSGTVDANVISVDGTSVTGPDDLKADTTDLATKANQEAINTNVKDASLIIPAGEDLPD